MKLRRLAVVFTLLAAAPLALASGPVCDHGQSPRNVDPGADPSPYQLAGEDSFLARADAETAVYLRRAGGPPQTLHRCGQHYHFPLENPQGCRGETPTTDYDAAAPDGAPPPGSWVEVHTVYAANEEHPPGCDPESLACCTEAPFLVRAFSATVTRQGDDRPIVPPTGLPLAEWTGSTTGRSTPGECKPEAMWSFHLGCRFSVSTAQLERFAHPDPARPVQEGERVSRDLTLIERE